MSALARHDESDDARPAGSRGPEAAPGVKDQRAERLAAALRENLRRRKAQARGRRADAGEAGGGKVSPGAAPDEDGNI